MKEFEHLSIVVPSYNGVGVLKTCLEIIGRIAPNAETIVVDGGSTDGSAELVREHFAWAKLLEVENFGWAHATNRGFEIATGKYLMTMNSDLFLNQAALGAMVKRLEEAKEVSGVSPVLLNGNGTRQWFFGTFFRPNWSALHQSIRINLLYGCCMMLRREVLETVGGFDENFFFYNEEFDFCWRMGKAGFKMEILPERVVHLEGSSTPAKPEFQIEAQRGGLYLMEKHFPGFISEATRRCAQLICWSAQFFDKRPGYNQAWHYVERMTIEKKYLNSSLPLSGRGEVKF